LYAGKRCQCGLNRFAEFLKNAQFRIFKGRESHPSKFNVEYSISDIFCPTVLPETLFLNAVEFCNPHLSSSSMKRRDLLVPAVIRNRL
jgi:hypothetical protein